MLVHSEVTRHFLFLQGPGGRFFKQLSGLLDAETSTTSRINVCSGDYFAWKRKDRAVNYRGRYENWKSFLENYVIVHGVTDIILFSDSRPYHRIAKEVSEDLDLNLFVFENGYLRPDWITMELGGVNGNSRFPRTRSAVEQMPAPPEDNIATLPGPTKLQSYWPDVKFHFRNTLLAPLYPFYLRHRAALPVSELIGHGVKWLTWPYKRVRSNQALDQLWRSGKSYFLYAMQLEHDFQLIEHSPFSDIREATARVVESFAENAPEDTVLLIKNHPLDNNLVSRRREVYSIAEQHGVSDRIVYIDMGPNPKILDGATGMVTVNSTIGTSALYHNVPVCSLGRAVYDIEGLTHQLGLDSFWRNPTRPDPDFFIQFRRALINHCQFRGRFVTAQGRTLATKACAERILSTPYVTSVRTRVKVAGSGEFEASKPVPPVVPPGQKID